MKYYRSIVAILLVVVLCSATIVTAQKARKIPIKIAFSHSQLPKRIDQDQLYIIEITWWNKEKDHTYQGSFVLIVEGVDHSVVQEDITVMQEDMIYIPQVVGNSLIYTFPVQEFPARAHGYLDMELMFHRAGEYEWRIQITES